MDSILELIITILGLPFENKFDDLEGKVNIVPKKGLRIFLKVLLILILGAFIFGLSCLFNYLFRGYWI